MVAVSTAKALLLLESGCHCEQGLLAIVPIEYLPLRSVIGTLVERTILGSRKRQC